MDTAGQIRIYLLGKQDSLMRRISTQPCKRQAQITQTNTSTASIICSSMSAPVVLTR